VVAVTTVVLFHSAQGQTPGFLAFADELRSAGHTIHAPDLFEGETFRTVDEGVAHAREVGFREIVRLGAEEAKELPADVVYAGFSLGVMPAQPLTRRDPARWGRSCSTEPSRPRSSRAHGPTACRCRST
jgi:esterase/lipase